MSLFPDIARELDIEDGEVLLYESFFTLEEADILYNNLLNNINWRQDYINMFGKTIPLPRMTAWYGDSQASYIYSGIKNKPNNWSDVLLKVKNKIEKVCDNNFNSLLLNKYKDGKDKLSWHADDEAELDSKSCIASLSLGSERFFSIKHKYKVDKAGTQRKQYSHKFILNHGSLLIMKPPMQKFWLHQVPASKNTKKIRINLTFRFINSDI